MSYNYEYLSDDKKITYLIKQIEIKEERLFNKKLEELEKYTIEKYIITANHHADSKTIKYASP